MKLYIIGRGRTISPIAAFMFAIGLLAGCHSKLVQENDENVGAIVGANYTNNGIQWFSVDGSAGESLGVFSGGGGSVCCIRYPGKWAPGQKMTVRWERSDGLERGGIRWKIKAIEKTVEIDRYTIAGNVYVLFFPDDRVKVVVSAVGVGSPAFPSHPGYPEAADKPKGL